MNLHRNLMNRMNLLKGLEIGGNGFVLRHSHDCHKR